MGNPLLELNGVSKSFKSFTLGNASFSLPGGTFIYLVTAGLLIFGIASLSFSIWIYRYKVTVCGNFKFF